MTVEDRIKEVIITIISDFNQKENETQQIGEGIERLEMHLRKIQNESINNHLHNMQISELKKKLQFYEGRRNKLRRIIAEERPIIDNIFKILIRIENISEQDIKFFDDLSKKIVNID